MKYFTREWYETREGSNLYFFLKTAKEAEFFYEEYYQTLYQSRLSEHLNSCLEMSKLTVDDVFPLDAWSNISTIDEKGNFIDAASLVSIEEFERIKQDIRCKELEARANFVPIVYDEEILSRQFQENMKDKQEYLRTILPSDIIRDVADIRVLAFDYASKDICDRIYRYCMVKEDKTYQIDEDYRAYYEGIHPSIPEKIKKHYGFHDCRVTSLEQLGDEITVTLDIRGGQTEVNQMIFHKADIIEQEEIIGGVWLSDEIYLLEDGYEFHASLQKEDGKIRYLTVRAEDVDFALEDNKNKSEVSE